MSAFVGDRAGYNAASSTCVYSNNHEGAIFV